MSVQQKHFVPMHFVSTVCEVKFKNEKLKRLGSFGMNKTFEVFSAFFQSLMYTHTDVVL